MAYLRRTLDLDLASRRRWAATATHQPLTAVRHRYPPLPFGAAASSVARKADVEDSSVGSRVSARPDDNAPSALRLNYLSHNNNVYRTCGESAFIGTSQFTCLSPSPLRPLSSLSSRKAERRFGLAERTRLPTLNPRPRPFPAPTSSAPMGSMLRTDGAQRAGLVPLPRPPLSSGSPDQIEACRRVGHVRPRSFAGGKRPRGVEGLPLADSFRCDALSASVR